MEKSLQISIHNQKLKIQILGFVSVYGMLFSIISNVNFIEVFPLSLMINIEQTQKFEELLLKYLQECYENKHIQKQEMMGAFESCSSDAKKGIWVHIGKQMGWTGV